MLHKYILKHVQYVAFGDYYKASYTCSVCGNRISEIKANDHFEHEFEEVGCHGAP